MKLVNTINFIVTVGRIKTRKMCHLNCNVFEQLLCILHGQVTKHVVFDVCKQTIKLLLHYEYVKLICPRISYLTPNTVKV